MNLPKNAIITGVSALALHKVISFSPAKCHLEMPIGTNATSYNDFVISTQSLATIKLGLIKMNGLPVYSIERLFVELNKFPLENTVKSEAIKNLVKYCNPSAVKRIYDKLKVSRRGLDDAGIRKYLDHHYDNIVYLVLEAPELKRKDILREYLIALVSALDVPVLLKGGSSIELFSEIKRSTYDVDTHSDGANIDEILQSLASPKYDIHFEPTATSIETLKQEKKVYQLSLIPKTSSVKLRDYFKSLGEQANMEISFNTTFSAKELKEIVVDFKLSKKRLLILKIMSPSKYLGSNLSSSHLTRLS